MIEIISVLFIIILLAPALLVVTCIVMLVMYSVGIIFSLVGGVMQGAPEDFKEFNRQQLMRDQQEILQFMRQRRQIE